MMHELAHLTREEEPLEKHNLPHKDPDFDITTGSLVLDVKSLTRPSANLINMPIATEAMKSSDQQEKSNTNHGCPQQGMRRDEGIGAQSRSGCLPFDLADAAAAGSELSARKKCPFAVKALPFYRLKDAIESWGGIYLTNEEGIAPFTLLLMDSGHGEATEGLSLAAVSKSVVMLEEERL
ncbi:hypothetical protein MUK42_35177 [Musa troglodytarum]|uniref:Uncharacterized protein n=1 Tax=Musa troglodytarum TaxID=320322 RepID=A0A9E7LFS4_9LILI|nr:hypothetical protein MUK42_35177 [Musa troglodytarum]